MTDSQIFLFLVMPFLVVLTGSMVFFSQECEAAPKVDPCSGRTMPWFSDTKSKFGGVTIDAGNDPADAMSSPAKSCI
jgi:hypothetical protein